MPHPCIALPFPPPPQAKVRRAWWLAGVVLLTFVVQAALAVLVLMAALRNNPEPATFRTQILAILSNRNPNTTRQELVEELYKQVLQPIVCPALDKSSMLCNNPFVVREGDGVCRCTPDHTRTLENCWEPTCFLCWLYPTTLTRDCKLSLRMDPGEWRFKDDVTDAVGSGHHPSPASFQITLGIWGPWALHCRGKTKTISTA